MQKTVLIPTLFFLCLLASLSFAQEMTVTGKVSEEGGSEIAGVNVVLKGTNRGTTTNDQGEFTIQAEKGKVLTFSFIGYNSQEATVNASILNVSLTPEATALNEVVVTALGIRKEKKALGYAVSEIKGDELTVARTPNMANSLAGKVAGLNITGTATGPAGSTRITLRGNGSISGNNQPLIVVDGIPINNENLGQAGMWGGADQGDGISSLNPDEIENISVLKGATAAALYGSRASNGAILVTTKGGKVEKGIGLEVNSNFLAEDLLIKQFKDYQYEYGMGTNGLKPTTVNEALTSNSWGAKLDGTNVIQFDGVSRPYTAQRDNLSKFYQMGSTFTNSVAFSGAAATSTYRFSMNNMDNKGVMPNSTLHRNNFALNVNSNLGKKLSILTNIKYVYEKTKNRPRLSDSPGNANYAIYSLASSMDVETFKDTKYDAAGNEKVWSDNVYVTNPYFAAYDFQNNDQKNRLIGAIEPRYNVLDWLYVKGRIGVDYFNYRYRAIEPYGTAYKLLGSYTSNQREFMERNMDLMVGIDKKFGDKFGFSLLVGGNQMRNVNHLTNLGGNNFNIPFFYDISNIDPAARTSSENYIERRINSLYGSGEFSFNNYLFITATARNDWFSTLASGYNSILYPSVGGSFVVSEAIQMPTAINYFKVRSSWAQAGGATDPYKLLLTYALSGAHNGAPLAQINNTEIPNSLLQPLTSTTFEAGLETRLFNNRLSADIAYYTRKTTNDIVNATVSYTSGYNAAVFNVGEISNKGIEVLLNFEALRKKSFTWNASFNMAYNKSEVINLYNDLQTLRVDENRTRTAYVHQDVGLPYSQVKGFDFKRDDQGRVVYDAQGYPLQGNLKSFGSGVSPWTLGFTNSFRYKGVGLSFLVDGKFGGKIFSGTNALGYRRGNLKETLPGREGGLIGEGVNEKGEPNQVRVEAQPYYDRIANNIATPFVYSSDFIKLRQVILDYSIPSKYLGSKLPFKAVSLSLTGRNLWIIHKKTPNIDPESNYSNSNAQGLEFYSAPPTRSMGVNLNLKF
jgi:TonB-linked SusC/RagA family outer membrane protein